MPIPVNTYVPQLAIVGNARLRGLDVHALVIDDPEAGAFVSKGPMIHEPLAFPGENGRGPGEREQPGRWRKRMSGAGDNLSPHPMPSRHPGMWGPPIQRSPPATVPGTRVAQTSQVRR